eukprot:TRINITY_DN5435_c0_g1_i2.p1 TRINITY_DN5435_c0_g1~~TRINITY_DN5435_c0_g1_i2.p1  ORF type:complete len:264 (-),score=30.44 TRINITY_DN5435_c0_g1_i2:49-840(-)
MATVLALGTCKVAEAWAGTAPAHRCQTLPAFITFVVLPMEEKSRLQGIRDSARISVRHLEYGLCWALANSLMTSALFYLQNRHVSESDLVAELTKRVGFVLTGCICLSLIAAFVELVQSVVVLFTRVEPVPFTKNLWKTVTVAELWFRWNTLVHTYLKRSVYEPLRRRGFSNDSAGVLTFLLSGLVHSLVLYQGFCVWSWEVTLFFVLNMALIRLQRSFRNLRNRAITCAALFCITPFMVRPLTGPPVNFPWGVTVFPMLVLS